MEKKEEKGVSVLVWGKLACFTSPETKVERVSYPTPTPSAARGILESIFWEPEMYYEVRQIKIINPLKWINIMRNEIKSKTSFTVAQRSIAGGEGYYHEDDRTQRNTLALKDVAYVIKAEIFLKPYAAEKYEIGKYLDQFNRRVRKGQCFRQPCMGLKEFIAFFEPANGQEPCNINIDCGFMLGEMEYLSPKSAIATPRLMPAKVVGGVLNVPRELYAPSRG